MSVSCVTCRAWESGRLKDDSVEKVCLLSLRFSMDFYFFICFHFFMFFFFFNLFCHVFFFSDSVRFRVALLTWDFILRISLSVIWLGHLPGGRLWSSPYKGPSLYFRHEGSDIARSQEDWFPSTCPFVEHVTVQDKCTKMGCSACEGMKYNSSSDNKHVSATDMSANGTDIQPYQTMRWKATSKNHGRKSEQWDSLLRLKKVKC